MSLKRRESVQSSLMCDLKPSLSSSPMAKLAGATNVDVTTNADPLSPKTVGLKLKETLVDEESPLKLVTKEPSRLVL